MLYQAITTHHEVTSTVLNILILFVATLTLGFTIPKRAKINVDRFAELKPTDLIFSIHPQQNRENKQQPTEYLFQLQVAVSNTGDRKAVLTVIQIEGFRNNKGETIHLPDAQQTIGGMNWLQESGWVNSQRHFQNITNPPPYILAADEVIVIRFRVRRGIDWSSRWNLEALKNFATPLQYPIVSAFGTIIWRRGKEIVNKKFEVNIEVEQQAEYVALLEELTCGYTVVPTLPERPIALE